MAPPYRPCLRGLSRPMAIARFKRIDGYDVFFMTGTDEHGLKVQQTARKERRLTQGIVDGLAPQFEAMGERLNCSFDVSSAPRIPITCPPPKSCGSGCRIPATSISRNNEGWYSVRDEAYFDEGELTLQPDGSRLAPTGAPVEWVAEGELLLPPFRLSGSPAGALRGASGIHRPRYASQTRSSPSSNAGCRISRSAALPSTGGCRYRVIQAC